MLIGHYVEIAENGIVTGKGASASEVGCFGGGACGAGGGDEFRLAYPFVIKLLL